MTYRFSVYLVVLILCGATVVAAERMSASPIYIEGKITVQESGKSKLKFKKATLTAQQIQTILPYLQRKAKSGDQFGGGWKAGAIIEVDRRIFFVSSDFRHWSDGTPRHGDYDVGEGFVEKLNSLVH